MERANLLPAGNDSIPLTAGDVRRRFQVLASNAPGLRGDHDLNPGMEPESAPREAAVLVPLVDHPLGLTVLLTQRTAHLSSHAGQISFPGGRIDPEDENEDAAALREAEEEIGLPRDHVEIVGRLDTWVSGTGFIITPVVGLVRPVAHLVPSPVEVAEIFEVPLDFILDKNNHQRRSRELGGQQRHFWAVPYEHRNIWGATAGILVNLAEALTG